MRNFPVVCCWLALGFLLPATHAAEPFAKKNVEGFTVYVSRKSIEEKPEVTKQALAHLQQQLFQVTVAVPAPAVKELKRVPIWLASGEKRLGIAFHPSRKWLTDRGYKPPAPKSLVGIMSGKLFLHEAKRQPWLTFHELTHGYDWFTLGNLKQYGNSLNAAGYRRAMKSGKYRQALHWNSRRRKPYHATNKMEFFAETSEAFFGTNDIFPFVRAELRDHDAETYRMVAALWKVDLGKEHAREAELIKILQTKKSKPGKTPLSQRTSVERIEGWHVRIDSSLSSSASQRLRRILQRDLHYVTRYIPARSLKQLQQTQIWVRKTSGCNYIRTLRHGKSNVVLIGNSHNYTRFSSLQPSVLLKKLAYLHYQQLPQKDRQAWTKLHATSSTAKTRGKLIFANALRLDGKRVAHPGLKSPRDLFAELSTCRFGTNDHYPFVTAELLDVAKDFHAALTKIWK